MSVTHAKVVFQGSNDSIHVAGLHSQGKNEAYRDKAGSQILCHRGPAFPEVVFDCISTFGTPKSPPSLSRSLGSSGPSMCTIVSSFGSAAIITSPPIRLSLSALK